MFTIPKDIDDKLNAFGAKARFIAMAGQSPKVKCELIEKLTGKVWLTEIGDSEEEALAAATKRLNPSDKPKTPAEIQKENEELRKEIDELKAKRKTEK